MNLKNVIFAPADFGKSLILEVNMDEIFKDTEEAYKKNPNSEYKIYEFDNNKYKVNVGNIRYHVMNKTRRCACCGLYATKMFLGEFEDKENSGYCFYLFGENKGPNDKNIYYNLFTMDHIVDKKDGGTNELDNLQCLCKNCNLLKDCLGIKDLKRIKNSLFLGYRIYRSITSLTKIDKLYEKERLQVKKLEAIVHNIGSNLNKIRNPNKHELVKQKMINAMEELNLLNQKMKDIEINAQKTGILEK